MAQKKYTLATTTIDIYLQKSLKFLYPLLGIGPKTTILPVNTYIAWKGEVGIHENKLVCVYELRDDNEFKQFEQKIIQGNDLYDTFKDAANHQRVYLFDLKKYREDILLFLKGKYSLMSGDTKRIIVEFYHLNKYSKEYMDSYLNPENYFEKYALLLNVEEWRLREVGELCDPYSRAKETLCIKKVNANRNTDKLVLF